MQYITYARYVELGGSVSDEATFNSLQNRIESKLNYITFGRLEQMADDDNLPSEIEMLEVDLIGFLDADKTETVKTGVQSYSNGIESITYAVSSDDIEKQLTKRIYTSAQEYLWNYPELFYRGRR